MSQTVNRSSFEFFGRSKSCYRYSSFCFRGAVLKNQLIEKEMKEQNDQQKAKFNDIRRRTEAIRER